MFKTYLSLKSGTTAQDGWRARDAFARLCRSADREGSRADLLAIRPGLILAAPGKDTSPRVPVAKVCGEPAESGPPVAILTYPQGGCNDKTHRRPPRPPKERNSDSWLRSSGTAPCRRRRSPSAAAACSGGSPYRPLTEGGKQSKKTLLDIFGHYIEGYMTLFDTIWSVK